VHRIASGQGGVADIEIAKRAAHTLKGAANTVGIKGIATLTHSLEDILVELAEHSALPNPGLSQTLTHAADCLEGMSEALAGLGEPPADAVNVLQDVLDWANRLDAEGIAVAAADPSDTPVPAQSDEHPVEAPHHRQDHAIAPMLRVPTTLVDEQLRLLGESMTSTAQIQNRLQSAMQQVMAVNLQNQLLRQLVNELEDLVDLRGIALPQPVKADTGFDALEFDQYGELHTVTRRLVEVTTDASEMSRTTQEYLSNLGELVGLQTRLHLANQDAVLRSRMVPVVSVVARLQRAVRQAGRLLDKEVHLVLKGTETLIDSSALNALVEALMHVLRNAVDHGIEPVEVRLARGKDPIGHIELAFKREGEVVSVTCRDDGQGLDLNHLRLVAQRRNLVGSTDVLSDDQVARFILIAGFSTRHDATQVSGRGIGLDAVNTMVEDLKGSIRLRNQPSHGLTVEIRLPTTLLSAQVLLIRLPGAVLALTTRGIEGIHFATADQFQTVGAQLAYRQGDQLHDVVQLLDLLNIGHGASKVQAEQAVLMVRMSSGASTAVTVAAIAESRSVVVKKLGPYVGQIGGVIGATILGDGSVAPVIDLPDLLRAASRAPRPAHGTALPRADAVDREVAVGNARTALVVDDSLSARRMTAQLFRDAGFEVQTAIDGLDAVAILNRSVPDVILTDLEMPRMNGLELTAHIRANPRTQQVPIVMITSRSTEKHRQQAFTNGVDRYLTKPFSAEELLSQVGTLTDRAAPQP
uniref:response regulator n=1 Tax=uncultured Thiodictyon sp. TaxID=1846217 RepID=UPI0025DB865A